MKLRREFDIEVHGIQDETVRNMTKVNIFFAGSCYG